MNRQLAVNDAVAGIVAQGGWSINSYGDCRYRAPNGCKCAIGHLIPNNNYNTGIEGSTAIGVSPIIAKKYNIGVKSDRSFLQAMQLKLHDQPSKKPFDIKSYARTVSAFCDAHGLELPPVLEQSK